MNIDVQPGEMDMSGKVAEEIRAMMGRRRMSGRDLARALEVSPSWVSYRLTGSQEIGVNDLARIAQVFGVPLAELLPASARATRDYGPGEPAPTVPMTAIRRPAGPTGRTDSRRPGARPPATRGRTSPTGNW